MTECECGCGALTASGAFLPGHDQKLRSALERRVGGVLALKLLVDSAESYASGEQPLDTHADQVRTIFSSVEEK